MRNSLLIISLTFLGLTSLFAQSLDRHVVASAGGQTVIGGSEYSFTFGEAIIGTTASNPLMTKGFHQPDSIIILTVRLIALGAVQKENGISIAWRLAEKSEGGHFIIERSLDNFTFEGIGSLPAGNGNDMNYEFIDSETYPSGYTLFYRIRYLSPDGRVMLSEWMTVNAETNVFLQAYPSPAADWLYVKYSYQEENKDIRASLTDIQGRKVWQSEDPQAGNGHAWKIPVSGLSPGIYTLTLSHDRGISSRKVIVWR